MTKGETENGAHSNFCCPVYDDVRDAIFFFLFMIKFFGWMIMKNLSFEGTIFVVDFICQA